MMMDMIFKTKYNKKCCITPVDLSESKVPLFEEVPAYSTDIQTGKLINPTKNPIYKPAGFKDLQEEINSYIDDCDIYKILQKVVASGDGSFLNQKQGFYGDISNLPNNLNDLNTYANNAAVGVDPDILKLAINDLLTGDKLNAAIDEIVAAKIKNTQVVNKEVVTNE